MKTIRVVAAIIQNNGKIFATQRGYGAYKDYWEFPGGKIEQNETPEQAIVREIQEELATTIHVDRFFMTVEHDYPEFHLSMDCFICSIVEGDLELLEHESAKWLSMDLLRSVAWLPADLLVIERLERQAIKKFVSKWLGRFNDPNVNYLELVDHWMADDCRSLGFQMDCGHAFSVKYSVAFNDCHALSAIINEITDIPLLGSAIFSKWRYYNHWAYSGSEILEPENREWFIITLNRLRDLSEEPDNHDNAS